MEDARGLTKFITRISIAIGVLLVNMILFSLISQILTGQLFKVDLNKLLADIDHSSLSANEINALRFFQGLVSFGTFFISSIVITYLFKERPGEYLGITKPIPKVFYFYIPLLLFVSIPFFTGLFTFNQNLQFPDALSNLENYFRDMELKSDGIYKTLLKMETPAQLFINLIVMALIPAVGEELFCRGVLLNILYDFTGKFFFSVIIVGIIFTLMHLQFFKFIPMLSMAFILGLFIYWTSGIRASIFFHFLNNSLVVIGNYLHQKGFNNYFTNEQSENPLWLIAVSFVITIGLIYYIHRFNKQTFLKHE